MAIGDSNNQGQINASDVTRIATNGGLIVQQLGNLINALTGLLPFSGATGTFTCAASATTTVTNTSVAANSIILITATNAADGTLMAGATSLYLSARTAGTSFAFATANAAAAAGTETFQFLIVNPSA